MTTKKELEKLRNAFASLTEAQNKLVETGVSDSRSWFQVIEKIKKELKNCINN